MKNFYRVLFLVSSTLIVVLSLLSFNPKIEIEMTKRFTSQPMAVEVIELTAPVVKVETTTKSTIPPVATTTKKKEESKRVSKTEDNNKPETTKQEEATTKPITDDFELFCKLVGREAGSNYIDKATIEAVATVVLNRVHDSRFPNTVRGVISQPGQYQPYNRKTGTISGTPTERVRKICKNVWNNYSNGYVDSNGEKIPSNVVWQSSCKQGKGVWKKVFIKQTGTTIYFCY